MYVFIALYGISYICCQNQMNNKNYKVENSEEKNTENYFRVYYVCKKMAFKFSE